MPVKMILCRLKDDHSVTKEIGETALMYFGEWEPVPDGDGDPEPKAAEAPQDEPETPAADPAKKTPARTRKAAETAEKDKE